MRYLEAKRLHDQRVAGTEENKMQGGSLPSQQGQGVSPELLARQLGVTIGDVQGTGENGAVTNKDVREHAKKVRAKNQEHPPVSSPKPPTK